MSKIEIETSGLNLSQITALIYARDKSKCQYTKFTGKNDTECSSGILHVHHIVPIKEGGKDESENLVLLCSKHHRIIHTKTQKKLPAFSEFISKNKITQTSLGGALGISQSAISQISSNGSCCLKTAKRIRNYLNLVLKSNYTIDDIFGI